MADSWDSWEPIEKSQKTIYSQSFSRGGGNRRDGPRNSRDDDTRPNRRDDNQGWNRRNNDRSDWGNRSNSGQYGRNQKSDNFDRGQRNRPRDDHDHRENGSTWESKSSSDASKVVQIDSRNVGKIIGRGGAKIKQLEMDSGAKININREKKGDQTEVTLSGEMDQISIAEQMINDLMSNDNFGSSSHDRDDSNASYGSRRNDRDSSRQFYGSRKDRDDSRQSSDFKDDRSNYGGSFESRDNQNDSRAPFGFRDDRNDSRAPFGSRDDRTNDQPFGGRDDRNKKPYGNRQNHKNDNSYQADSYQDNYSNQYNESQNSYQKQSSAPSQPDPEFKAIDWDSVYKESDAKAAAYLASLPPIVKQLYHEEPEVANMSPSEVSQFRLNNMNISVTRVFSESKDPDKPIPNPVRTFEQAFKPYPEILKTIYDQKFQTPSPIQCQSWPVILSGEDMIGIAQTGTGKTLAFLLPAMIHIEAQPTPRINRVGPTVLILSPTRELAQQIEKEINKYSYRNIKCVCVYGGGSRKDQVKWLNQDKPEIVVATPGRLDDIVMSAELKLDSVTYVVLDEADKMLEMGFECQIRKILLNIRADRQTVMTSATWPSAVRRLASQYSVNPVQVLVGSLDLTAVHSVTQRIEIVDEDDKREKLDEFLTNMAVDDKVIVFCGKKSVTDDISSDLILKGVKCQSLHGNREQCDREQALADLKSGEVRILIATDVAARGLDVSDITHVFNFDFPKNIEEYVHRIGRTGRAGRSGESVSLFTRRDWANAAELIRILNEANQGVPTELSNMAERFEAMKKRRGDDPHGGRRGGGGRGGRGGGGRGGRGFY